MAVGYRQRMAFGSRQSAVGEEGYDIVKYENMLTVPETLTPLPPLSGGKPKGEVSK